MSNKNYDQIMWNSWDMVHDRQTDKVTYSWLPHLTIQWVAKLTKEELQSLPFLSLPFVFILTIKFNVKQVKQKPLEIYITWKVVVLEFYIFPGYKNINMLLVILFTIKMFMQTMTPFLWVKASTVHAAGGSFYWNYATNTSVTTSVAIMQILRFHCNYASGNFCHQYVSGSFCCNYVVRNVCSTYAGNSKFVGDNFLL